MRSATLSRCSNFVISMLSEIVKDLTHVSWGGCLTDLPRPSVAGWESILPLSRLSCPLCAQRRICR